MDVGIRELRDHLSRYVERAREGEEITVTDHGKPVARLVPLDEADVLSRLIAEGVVTPAERPKQSRSYPRIKPKGTVSDLVRDDRP